MPSFTIVLNAHGQPLDTRFNQQRNFTRSMESLIGIVRGLLADCALNEKEVVFLGTWLRDNREVVECWPGDVIAERIHRALGDGYLSADELADIQSMLSQLIGGQVEDTGATSGDSTQLPVDPCDALTFVGKTYCFTGKFICGTREYCQAEVLRRGGEVLDGITKKLDYLVVGGLASRDWAHTSYGRKIEKAVEYKRRGAPTLILAEERWKQLLPVVDTA